MDKIFFGGIVKKQNQKGGTYYLMSVWCPASYNKIEEQKDNYYYIVDEGVYEAFKTLEMNTDISNLVDIKLTANSTKLVFNNKEYSQR